MVSALSRADVDRLRLASLLLDAPADPTRTPVGVIEHFLAMQAQDAPGVAFSLGLRTGLCEREIDAALDSREIVRTWPMRGTLHLVPSRDAKWMLALMGDRTLGGAARRRNTIGLPDDVAYRAVDVLADAVARAPSPMARAECAAVLTAAGIGEENNWTYHLLWFASALGHLAGGPPRGKEQTYVSLDTWAPEHRSPSTDEALALIASAYVRGHGPVTARELARWTGLGLRESRSALAMAEGVVAVDTDDGPAWVSSAALDTVGLATAVPTRLLPGFDEFMLGYSEAERAIDPAHHAAVVPGSNGIFKATVVDRGRVVALWGRKPSAKSVRVTVTPLVTLGTAARSRIEKAAVEYATYVGLPLEVRWAAG
jgi:hypothetical protein